MWRHLLLHLHLGSRHLHMRWHLQGVWMLQWHHWVWLMHRELLHHDCIGMHWRLLEAWLRCHARMRLGKMILVRRLLWKL